MKTKTNKTAKINRTNLLKSTIIFLIIILANTSMAQVKMTVHPDKKDNKNCVALGVRVKKNQNQAIWIKGVQVIVYNIIPLAA